MHIRSYNFTHLFRILRSAKMKFGQVLVQPKQNISNLFLSLL